MGISWPQREAKKILSRFSGKKIVLETGFSATGLPHIGTFAEIARTSMIKRALQNMTDVPITVIVFSDDLDAMLKVPTNVPNQNMLKKYINKPMTMIPDPFEECNSFGEYNNNQMKKFINRFNFDVEFYSSTYMYKNGKFNDLLLKILRHKDEILNIMLPSVGPERRKTYSPFIPILSDGTCLVHEVVDYTDSSVIAFHNGKEIEIPVTNGNCKLQWKVDWPMRWCALNVNYEMSGSDHINTVKLSSQICKVLEYPCPAYMHYELFVDENKNKISKSIGNGISLNQWLQYTPDSVLKNYLYQRPESAKRLCLDVIPRQADEYINNIRNNEEKIIYIDEYHTKINSNISYSMLLNIANACDAEKIETLLEYIEKYENISEEELNFWKKISTGVLKFYQDNVKPSKKYKIPNQYEKDLIIELKNSIKSSNDIKTTVYDIGKKYEKGLTEWFKMIYQVLLGQESGPRLFSFIEIYGINDFCKLIDSRLVSNKNI